MPSNPTTFCPAGYLADDVAAFAARLGFRKGTLDENVVPIYNEETLKGSMALAERIGSLIRSEFNEEQAEIARTRRITLESCLTSRTGGMAELAQIAWMNSYEGKITDIFKGLGTFYREVVFARSQKAEAKRQEEMAKRQKEEEAAMKKKIEEGRLLHLRSLADGLLQKYLPLSKGEVRWQPKQTIILGFNNRITLKEGVFVQEQFKMRIYVDIDNTLRGAGYVGCDSGYSAYTHSYVRGCKSFIWSIMKKEIMNKNKETVEQIYQQVHDKRVEAEAMRRLKHEHYEAAVRSKMDALRR